MKNSRWFMMAILMFACICSAFASIPVITLNVSTGTTNWNPRYTTFGPVSTPTINAPSFATRRRDPTGLYYFGARYYDPQTGHFTQPDPARFTDSRNLYAFCANNPMTRSDPDGRLSAQNMASVYNPDQNASAQYGSYGTENWEYSQNHLAAMAQTLRPVGEIMGGDIVDFGYLGVDIYNFVQNPSWQGAGAIAVGVGLAALPVVSKPLANAAEGVVDATKTKLYRAVTQAEYDDIIATGKFRPGQNSYETGKFFAESAEDAAQWGKAFEGEGKFRIIEVEISSTKADQFMRWDQLDGIGPARFAEILQLGDAVINP